VVSCDSGAAALAAAADFHPHLLLLDVMMPDMDGSDTLRALRRLENTADVPAIFMTAKAQTTQLAGLRNLGVLDVLIKPFDPRTLSDCLNEI
jgi:two-component system OmpR family response regulator